MIRDEQAVTNDKVTTATEEIQKIMFTPGGHATPGAESRQTITRKAHDKIITTGNLDSVAR